MENNILKPANDIKDELIQLRRRFHAEPELGYEEYKTSEFISQYLMKLGLKVQTGIGGTGVSAILESTKHGKVIGLRADIDALPIMEENTDSFKSKIDGKMHACGHDAHTAILLGTAKILSENRDRLTDSVKFIFQPAEELVTGAKAMIDDGVMDNPKVDIMLGLHVITDIPSGHIELKSGAITSSTDEFEITIQGKGGHGSNPQNTIDPIVTGAQLVTAIQTIVSRKITPSQPAVVSVGRFIAGDRYNVIPPEANICGTIRCQDEQVRSLIADQLDTLAKGICMSAGANYKLKISRLVPAVMNDKALFEEFLRCSQKILSEDKIEIPNFTRTYGEDFSRFGEIVPAMFFYLGTLNESKGCIYPVHSNRFSVDEDILPLGAALFVNFCFHNRT